MGEESFHNLCWFDPWNPCRNIKAYRKLCASDEPYCRHIHKRILEPGNVEFFVMMDSTCYRESDRCDKGEGSQLRFIARLEHEMDRHSREARKITYELTLMDGDSLCFEAKTLNECATSFTGSMHVLPPYSKVDFRGCAHKSASLVKKQGSALEDVPMKVSVRSWKDEIIAGESTEFTLTIAVPPSESQIPETQQPAPLRVFISYAREDSKIVERLKRYLESLQDNGVVSFWHDREIKGGAEWSHEIEANLKSANIVLLVMSLDFLSSTYIETVEVETALKRQKSGEARVIPVIVRESDWKRHPRISELQSLPKSGKPISKYANEDEWFTEVKNEFREVITELMGAKVKRSHR